MCGPLFAKIYLGNSPTIDKIKRILILLLPIYSASCIVLFGIMAWTLAQYYRRITVQVNLIGIQMKNGFVADLSDYVKKWVLAVDLVDGYVKETNDAVKSLLVIEISSLFLRAVNGAITLVTYHDSYTNGLIRMFKYSLHLWIICYAADTTIREVGQVQYYHIVVQ